jgi:chromosome segregation ATPase
LSSGPPTPNGNEKTDATPLFFAFEKQAELNTVRDEITRLAALLGDAESAKMEATEAMNEMRTRMEEAESRLRRYEKLAPANGSRNNGASSFPGSQSYGNRRAIVNPSLGRDNGHAMSSQNDSTVSLEYLKNIMLRYLNASTLNEKRSLVPVLGAVLELTQDEQNLAIQNVEKSAGVTGVGVSLIENIQNKGFNGLFG